MKVYEVLEKKQINEALPIIGGIGLGGILTAISIGIAAWSAYDVYNFIKKYNEDPEKITDEEWEELFIDAILMFTPGFLKLGRAGVAKIVPKAAKTKGGKWLRSKINKRYAEVAAKRATRGKYSIKGLTGKQRTEMLAKRAAASKTAAAAGAAALSANAAVAGLIRTLGLGAVIGNYLIQIAAIEEDFVELRDSLSSGKEVSEDNIFKGMSFEEAKEQGQNLRQDLLGEAALQMVGLGLAGRIIGALGKFANLFGIIGQVFGRPLQFAGWLATLGGGAKMTAVKTALTAWFSTESGQEWLKQFAIGLALISAGQWAKSTLGPIMSWSADIIVKLLDEALAYISEKTGIPLSVPDAAKSPFSPISPDQATKDVEDERAANVKFVGGVPATTGDGYLRNDRAFWLTPNLGIIARRNANNNKPHPLQGLPLNPKLTYPSDLMAKVGFTPS